MVTRMTRRKFIDIGANLTDAMFRGQYNGKERHVPDLGDVLERASKVNVKRIVVTAGNASETSSALDIIREFGDKTDIGLHTSVGVHPTRCNELESNSQLLEELVALSERREVVALGEFGLDYERLQFCPKEVQLRQFERQLSTLLSAESNKRRLPLFLHCRNACDDLCRILDKFDDIRGVVHSFDGSEEEARRVLNLGLHIGINGCSMRTEQSLDVIRSIPASRLLLETDSPWCELRPSHASHNFLAKDNELFPAVKKEKWTKGARVKSRNEPCNILDVFEVVAAVREESDPDQLAQTIYDNSMRLFFPNET